jgi:hypothetical protein
MRDCARGMRASDARAASVLVLQGDPLSDGQPGSNRDVRVAKERLLRAWADVEHDRPASGRVEFEVDLVSAGRQHEESRLTTLNPADLLAINNNVVCTEEIPTALRSGDLKLARAASRSIGVGRCLVPHSLLAARPTGGRVGRLVTSPTGNGDLVARGGCSFWRGPQEQHVSEGQGKEKQSDPRPAVGQQSTAKRHAEHDRAAIRTPEADHFLGHGFSDKFGKP